jgi:hypothetical protein
VTDEPFYSPQSKPAPARVAKPGFLLFEFVRASDRANRRPTGLSCTPKQIRLDADIDKETCL